MISKYIKLKKNNIKHVAALRSLLSFCGILGYLMYLCILILGSNHVFNGQEGGALAYLDSIGFGALAIGVNLCICELLLILSVCC